MAAIFFILGLTISSSLAMANPTVPSVEEFSCKEAPSEFRCADGSACIPGTWVCDGRAQCRDQSDEPPGMSSCQQFLPNCTFKQFRCDNGRCIDVYDACDGSAQCADGSDEKYCITGDCGHPQLFQCKTTGQCIPSNRVCNEVVSCDDGDLSDEVGCFNHTNCPVHTFACSINGKLRCINNINRCDLAPDCDNAEDEIDCPFVEKKSSLVSKKKTGPANLERTILAYMKREQLETKSHSSSS